MEFTAISKFNPGTRNQQETYLLSINKLYRLMNNDTSPIRVLKKKKKNKKAKNTDQEQNRGKEKLKKKKRKKQI